MSDVQDLRDTIVPKSDQLNADDLLTGPITAKITAVRRASGAEQPISVHLDGRLPYKPCKGMRRVLIVAWGEKGPEWVGRSMTLYRNPEVRYGGVQVGGIEISHLSHISGPLEIALTVTRGKKKLHKVLPLPTPKATTAAKPPTPTEPALTLEPSPDFDREAVIAALREESVRGDVLKAAKSLGLVLGKDHPVSSLNDADLVRLRDQVWPRDTSAI